MSLKSKPLVIEENKESVLMPIELTRVAEEIKLVTPLSSKAPCWCLGRKGKEHHVGEPFCYFPSTYLPPGNQKPVVIDGKDQLGNLIETPQLVNLTKSPVTFDEELLMSCINRAIMKTPSDFVTMLDEGRVNFIQARRINNELRLMGYGITEDPF